MSVGSVAAFEEISDSESDVIVILTQHESLSLKEKNCNDISMFYKVIIL